jgi:DNA helicase II / ATP-dependent DNA helicase PcrA
MIALDTFYEAYQSFRPLPNAEQREAIEQTSKQTLFIVAGPGTGKTTCLALRILKLALVDDVPPRGILATTFTVKAAAELRSRILGWGFRLIEELKANHALPSNSIERLNKLDINQVLTGTIDSICERVLRDYREAGTQPPVLVDDYVAKTLMLREGLFKAKRYEDPDLDTFFLALHGGSRWGFNVGKKNDLAQSIWDHHFQDQVDWRTFLRNSPRNERGARTLIGEIFDDYNQALLDRGMMDFAMLEQAVLTRLRNNQLAEFLEQVKVLLVDEYQDTNLLQESIYFEIAKECEGALTVVGDDDQSLYRFRGATVELFSDFEERCQTALGQRPKKVFLKTNYRSTQTVVGLVNNYAALDTSYQSVRVKDKPQLGESARAEKGTPVLGMFRADVTTLASDLADFIHEVFRGKGYRLPDGSLVRAAESRGDVGDCTLLCSSPAEYSFANDPRLPLLVRQALHSKEIGIETFNPRGQDLTGIPVIERFSGLLLECLDPGGVVEAQIRNLPRDINATLRSWRRAALDFVESPEVPDGLKEYAIAWADRDPRKAGWKWPHSVPVLQLIYALVHFFPELYDDPEGQVYLEVFTRQVSACEQVGKFSARVVTDHSNPTLADASIKELIRDFLGPIASGSIKVNEDLMEAFPRDRLSILSVHQAKGLEFPLTIVDVGSDFRSNHRANAFKRFPVSGGPSHAMEDLLRPYTSLGAPIRSAVDRAFDDLYRQYFVAFSRPQEVLLLVGLTTTLPGGVVPNVATGWSRTGDYPWASSPPFLEI